MISCYSIEDLPSWNSQGDWYWVKLKLAGSARAATISDLADVFRPGMAVGSLPSQVLQRRKIFIWMLLMVASWCPGKSSALFWLTCWPWWVPETWTGCWWFFKKLVLRYWLFYPGCNRVALLILLDMNLTWWFWIVCFALFEQVSLSHFDDHFGSSPPPQECETLNPICLSFLVLEV